MRRVHAVILSLVLLSLSACALFPNRDPVNINVVGLEPLPSQDLEVRFAIKLRVQNPNETAIDFDGLALDLDSGDLQYRVPHHPSGDHNTVELGVEQAAFAQNATGFQASLTFLQMKLKGLAQAIQGQ